MLNDTNFTVHQHYIPQVYLRGFSPLYQKGNDTIPTSKYTIYRYDIKANSMMKDAVPIKTVCREDYLYEFKGEMGNYLLPNHLENIFCEFEKMFGKYRSKLEQKAFCKANYQSLCFLERDEKIFWELYMIMQILRLPQTLKIGEEASKVFFEEKVQNNQHRNISLMACLPFYKELDSNELNIIEKFFEPMSNMTFHVGVDLERRIITSDQVVSIMADSFPCEEYDEIVFPITSELCLFLLGNESKLDNPKNELFQLNDLGIKHIFESMARSSFGYLYANHSFSEKEPMYIIDLKNSNELKKIF